MAMACFKVRSHKFPGGSEEYHKKPVRAASPKNKKGPLKYNLIMNVGVSV